VTARITFQIGFCGRGFGDRADADRKSLETLDLGSNAFYTRHAIVVLRISINRLEKYDYFGG
jgi:hypothetical protein